MPRYRLNVDGKISGPFTEVALHEMASVRAFDNTAFLAPENTEDWKLISEMPELEASLFPPKKSVKLKVREFEKVEVKNDDVVSVDQILRENLEAEASTPHKAMKRLPNRRRRDFLFSLIVIDGVLGGLWHYLPRSQETDVAFGSAAILCTVGIYWLFYHIMDRY
jgi:hypothetical protein